MRDQTGWNVCYCYTSSLLYADAVLCCCLANHRQSLARLIEDALANDSDADAEGLATHFAHPDTAADGTVPAASTAHGYHVGDAGRGPHAAHARAVAAARSLHLGCPMGHISQDQGSSAQGPQAASSMPAGRPGAQQHACVVQHLSRLRVAGSSRGSSRSAEGRLDLLLQAWSLRTTLLLPPVTAVSTDATTTTTTQSHTQHGQHARMGPASSHAGKGAEAGDVLTQQLLGSLDACMRPAQRMESCMAACGLRYCRGRRPPPEWSNMQGPCTAPVATSTAHAASMSASAPGGVQPGSSLHESFESSRGAGLGMSADAERTKRSAGESSRRNKQARGTDEVALQQQRVQEQQLLYDLLPDDPFAVGREQHKRKQKGDSRARSRGRRSKQRSNKRHRCVVVGG